MIPFPPGCPVKSYKLGEIITANQHDNAQKAHKKPADTLSTDSFADGSSGSTADDSAKNHPGKEQYRHLGNIAAHNRKNKICCLRNQNNEQGVLGGYLGFHGEEIIQNDQIHRAAAYAEES